MLKCVSNLPPFGGQAATETPKLLRGRWIAQASTGYPTWQRILDAAAWVRGELTIQPPTLALAARIWGVSSTAVANELSRDIGGKRFRAILGSNSASLSDDAVMRIVAEVGVERVWRAVDKLTQPPLPFVTAAE